MNSNKRTKNNKERILKENIIMIIIKIIIKLSKKNELKKLIRNIYKKKMITLKKLV